MPIDFARLAASIGTRYDSDVEHDLALSLQRALEVASILLRVDAAGMMLADAKGVLRAVTASDQRAQAVDQHQEASGRGPCIAAYNCRTPVAVRDLFAPGHHRLPMTGVLTVRAALSVPMQLRADPVGTLQVYQAFPRDWDAGEVNALQTYAAVLAGLIEAAIAAQAKEGLIRQLQTALANRVAIEQAKGMLMAREGLDAATAFERLRVMARSSRRRVAAVAEDFLNG
jgi:signal transduction protein with GAF and PtsI domain